MQQGKKFLKNLLKAGELAQAFNLSTEDVEAGLCLWVQSHTILQFQVNRAMQGNPDSKIKIYVCVCTYTHTYTHTQIYSLKIKDYWVKYTH